MVLHTGDLKVGVNGHAWTFNPACLIPAPEENPPELPAGQANNAIEPFGLYDCNQTKIATIGLGSGLLGGGLEGLSSSGLLGDHEGMEDLQMKLLTMLGNSALLVAAAAKGDEATVRDYLTKNPHEVCHLYLLSEK